MYLENYDDKIINDSGRSIFSPMHIQWKHTDGLLAVKSFLMSAIGQTVSHSPSSQLHSDIHAAD